MFRFRPDERHFWLTQGVARTLGINLTGALAEGRLDRRGYAQVVARCEACRRAEDCTRWMAQQQGASAEAPPFCSNKALLDRLVEDR